MTDHTCEVPAFAPQGKWTCECGERWFTAVLHDADTNTHTCTPPVGYPGRHWTCPCGTSWYAHGTIIGTYEWRTL